MLYVFLQDRSPIDMSDSLYGLGLPPVIKLESVWKNSPFWNIFTRFYNLFWWIFTKMTPPLPRRNEFAKKSKIYILYAKYPSCSGNSKVWTRAFSSGSVSHFRSGINRTCFWQVLVEKSQELPFSEGYILGTLFAQNLKNRYKRCRGIVVLDTRKGISEKSLFRRNGSVVRGWSPTSVIQLPWPL